MTSPRPRDLVTPEARALRAALEALPETADPAGLSAVRSAHPGADADLMSALATQVRLQRRARGRLGAWAEDLILDEEALQQATRRDVARYRAARLVERLGREGSTVADLGCGLGVDAFALAEAGCRVVAVERDPWRAEAAQINLARYGDQVRVLPEDVTALAPEVIAACDAAYVDPARRASGGPRRIDGGRSRAVTPPEEWSPPWSWVVALSERIPVVAKVAPGFDTRLARPGADLEWIDDDGETVELAVWMGGLGGGMRCATALRGDRAETIQAPRGVVGVRGTSTSQVADLLIEPTPAVIRADLVAELAGRLGAAHLDAGTWLTADAMPATLLARAWRVIEEVPHDPRALRAWLRGSGSVTWKTADTHVSAADWERRVGHRPAKAPAVTIVITGAGRAFAVERHTPLTASDASSLTESDASSR